MRDYDVGVSQSVQGAKIITHVFLVSEGDIECGLKIGRHAGDERTLEMGEVRHDQQNACVLRMTMNTSVYEGS